MCSEFAYLTPIFSLFSEAYPQKSIPPTFPPPVVIYYFNCVVAENAFCALHFIADSVCFYPFRYPLSKPPPLRSRWGVKSVAHTNTRMFVAALPCVYNVTYTLTYELKYKYTRFLWGLFKHLRLFANGACSTGQTDRKILRFICLRRKFGEMPHGS